MSIAIRATTGRHSAAFRIADLEAQLAEERAANAALRADNDQLACELIQTIVRASQDAMWRAAADQENQALKAANKQLRHTTIRAKAEQERLRRAVVNARPRIREVPTELVRPYSPVVVLPYISPAPYRDTSNDQTQELPILDRP